MAESDLADHNLTRSIIGAFYAAHTELGFGWVESVCADALEYELRARGHEVTREYAVRVRYKDIELGFQRLDMVVDHKVVLEIKATAVLHAYAPRQLRNYLRATNLEIGLVLHFGRVARVIRVYAPNLPPPQKAPAVPPQSPQRR